MTQEDSGAKEKIFQATWDLIAGGEDAGGITVRQIAAKAGVNAALVNYYYQSKENLLNAVVGTMMGDIIGRAHRDAGEGADARTRLLGLLLATADAAFAHYNVCRIALIIELKHGCQSSCEMILPLLKEMLPQRTESELRITALQLMQPFHHIMIEPGLYGEYLGADFFDKEQRTRKVEEMMDCVIKESGRG